MSIRESDADIAFDVLTRAYHVLAVFYELSNPGAYDALHEKMMPYLLGSFGPAPAARSCDPSGPETMAAVLERVRCALDDVRSDVSAVRTRRRARDH